MQALSRQVPLRELTVLDAEFFKPCVVRLRRILEALIRMEHGTRYVSFSGPLSNGV